MKAADLKIVLSLMVIGVVTLFVVACGKSLNKVEPQVIVVTATPTATSTVMTYTPEVTTPTIESTIEEIVETVPGSIPYPPGTLLQGSGRDIFYLTEERTRQRIYNLDTFLAYGFKEENIVVADDDILEVIPLTGVLTRLVLDEQGDLYWVRNGERWLVNEWRQIAAPAENIDPPVTQADASLLMLLPIHLGFEPGTLLRDADTVYYFDGSIDIKPELIGVYASIIPVPAGSYNEVDVVEVPPGVLAIYNQKVQLDQTNVRLNGETPAANVRQGPGLDREVLGIIQQTEPITAYGRTADDLWVLISFQDQYGWLATDLIQPTPALPLLPVGISFGVILGDVPEVQPAVVAEEQDPEPGPVYCSSVPIRGFGKVWGDHPEVQATLGCPSVGNEQGTRAAVQVFEHGIMLWLETDSVYGADPVYVFFDVGNYQRFGDLGPADPAKVGTVPAGYHQVGDKFSKIYWEGTGARVKEQLGWAIGTATDTAGAFQQFRNGRMFWVEVVDRIFIIYDYFYYDDNDNYVQIRTWASLEDLF